MKGQYRIVTEVMLFAIGVAITSYVILSFGNVHAAIADLSLRDNMDGVANLVVNGLVKASAIKNTTLRIEIPDKIAQYTYKIALSGDQINVSSMDKPDIFVIKQLFNMSQNYIISGETVSSAKFIEIVFDGTQIKIKRSVR